MSNSIVERIVRFLGSDSIAKSASVLGAVILAGCILTGCGGSDDGNAVDAGGGGASTSDGSGTKSPGAGGSGAGSADSSQMAPGSGSSTKGDADSGAGMQLPDTVVPEAGVPDAGTPSDGPAKDESGGPTQPGSGGLEMPEITPPGGSSSVTPATTSELNLQFASWKEIESRATSTGKVTVVDLWSTVCEPCVKEFPGLVRLSDSMSDRVACIGVSVDYDGRKTKPPETYSERVSGFLNAVGADFDNYVCNTPSDDVFSIVGLPSIPAVLIYDAKGQLVKQFVDAGETIGFSYEKDIIPFVEKLAG